MIPPCVSQFSLAHRWERTSDIKRLSDMRFAFAVLFLGLLACGRRECPETVEHAPTAALKADLYEIRRAIDDFTRDSGRCPRSLNELVPKYLRRVPVDPVTRSAETWVYHDCDVNSGATGRNCAGQLYSSF